MGNVIALRTVTCATAPLPSPAPPQTPQDHRQVGDIDLFPFADRRVLDHHLDDALVVRRIVPAAIAFHGLFAGDPLLRRDSDPGYQVGWRHKVRFEKGHLEGEMSYGEASRRAAELQAKDTEGKVYFPEMIRTLEG